MTRVPTKIRGSWPHRGTSETMKGSVEGMRKLISISTIVSVAWLSLSGCADLAVTSNPALRNPTDTTSTVGGTDDIYDATQQAIGSLLVSENVRQHIEAKKGNRVVLNKIVNESGIPNYDENLIYNKLLSGLTNNAGGRFIFLNRGGGSKRERDLQLSGQAKTSGVDAVPAGADMILDLQLRQISSPKSKAIQYTFSLTNLADEILWTDSFEIQKTR